MSGFKRQCLFLVLVLYCLPSFTMMNCFSTGCFTKGNTPMDKVQLRLEKYLQSNQMKIQNSKCSNLISCCCRRPSKLPIDAKFAVVLTTGAMNPIHKSHIRMLELAKEELESQNWIVLGGFLSSTHDDYVCTKGDWIPGLHRKEMATRALINHEYIVHDNYEIDHSEFVHSTGVAWKLGKTLNANFKNIDVRVFYVVGGDRSSLAHNMLMSGASHGAIVVRRDCDLMDRKTLRMKDQFMQQFGVDGKYFWIKDKENMKENVSSSEVRERIRKNQDISDLVPQEVVDYMNKHDITFKENFTYEDKTIVWDFKPKK